MPVDVMQVEGDPGEILVPGSDDACLTAPLRLNEDMMKAYMRANICRRTMLANNSLLQLE
jgi:hypothetical protein